MMGVDPVVIFFYWTKIRRKCIDWFSFMSRQWLKL
jgi:hypothetical protein